MEIPEMSKKERNRLDVLKRLNAGKLSQPLMGLFTDRFRACQVERHRCQAMPDAVLPRPIKFDFVIWRRKGFWLEMLQHLLLLKLSAEALPDLIIVSSVYGACFFMLHNEAFKQ